MHGIETELLSMFDGYARSNDKRVYQAEVDDDAPHTRMFTLESGFGEVERRLNTLSQ